MKIILTENQFKDNVINLIKTKGWEDTSLMIGLDIDEMAEMFFNNDPMEFLNIFNDLNVVQSEKNRNWTLFRCEKGNNIMIYDRKTNILEISYPHIWFFLKLGFDFSYRHCEEAIQKWVTDTYDLNKVEIEPGYTKNY
jgi:hypothetical protein